MEFEKTFDFETISSNSTPLTSYEVREHKRVYNLRETTDYILSEIKHMQHTKFQIMLDLDSWKKSREIS